MITEQEITGGGEFIKTHGIHGELNASLSVPIDFFELHPMFVCEVDGIYVPFFIESIRPRGSQSALIKPCDVNNEAVAKLFAGKTIYIIKKDLMDYEQLYAGDETEGAYADDLIGYKVVDTQAGDLGIITGIEDSTANLLFILRTPANRTLYIPVAEPFIISINPESQTIETSLPEGLTELNN